MSGLKSTVWVVFFVLCGFYFFGCSGGSSDDTGDANSDQPVVAEESADNTSTAAEPEQMAEAEYIEPETSDVSEDIKTEPESAVETTVGTGTLAINEIMAKDADGGTDWIEFYAMGEGYVFLGEYTVRDDNEDREPAALPEVILQAGEYVVVQATDEDPGDGSWYVPFKLGSDDAVVLMHDGVVVDTLDWEDGDAPEGFGFGRLPDGTGPAQTLTPTPNATNIAAGEIPVEIEEDPFPTDRVLDVFIELSDSDWNSILSNPTAEEEKPATITYDGVTLENVSFRTKGNSSLMHVANSRGTRFSYKVDMNEYIDGQKLMGLKKINFNNSFKDPTYMRERIAYDLMREMGVPSARNAYANLYVNGTHMGLYLAVEEVDSEFIERHFEDDNGDLYKPDGVGSDLRWLGDNIGAYSGMELETNSDTSDHSDLIAMLDVLNNGSDYASVIDVDRFLRYLAVSTALSNFDSYQGSLAHNYYLYEENGVFCVIPWDLNEAFGTFSGGCDTASMMAVMIDEPTSGALSERPLIAKLLARSDYLETYHGYMEELVYGSLDPNAMAQTISEIATLIDAHVAADPNGFYTYREYRNSLTMDVAGSFGLQPFVETRVANIRSQLNGSAVSSGDGSGNCGAMWGPMGGQVPTGPGAPMGPPPGL